MRILLPALLVFLFATSARASIHDLRLRPVELAAALPEGSVRLVEVDQGGGDAPTAARMLGAAILGISGCSTLLGGGTLLLFGIVFLSAGGSAAAGGIVFAVLGGLVSLAGIVMLGMTTLFFMENGGGAPTTVVGAPDFVVARPAEKPSEYGGLAVQPMWAAAF